VVLLVALLGVFRLHGSSVGVYGQGIGQTEDEVGALTGPLRPIRSDEWGIRTPWVLRQTENGFANQVESSVGTHDARMLGDLPTSSWDVVIRPQGLPYRVLPTETAYATEWWLYHAIQVLGVYALLLALTRRIGISALGASLVVLAPTTQWWTGPGTYTTVGYGCLAGALLLWAVRAQTSRSRWSLTAAAGWALGAFGVATYVPWQISTVLVVAPVVVGAVLPDILDRTKRKDALRRFVTTALVAGLIGGVLVGGFLADKTDEVRAIAGTVYPGERAAAEAGTVPPVVMLGGALDSYAAEPQFALANGLNQSENSSGIAYFIPAVLVAFGLLARGSLSDRRAAVGLGAALVPVFVMLAWMQLPLPSLVGKVLLLNRVPAERLLPGLTLAGVLALVVASSTIAGLRSRLPRSALWGSAAGLGLSVAWAAGQYRVEGQPIPTKGPLVIAAVLTIGVALCFTSRRIIGFSVLALFGLWQASLVNPVQHGLDPILDHDLRAVVDRLDSEPGDDHQDGWLLLSVDAYVKGIVTASGVQNLSMVSPYPDADAYRTLDPTGAAEDVWNRYGTVSFNLGEPGTPPAFSLLGPDNLAIAVDPCDPAIAELGAGFIVTQGFELVHWCVRPVESVLHGPTTLFVYDIRTGRSG